MNLDIFNNLTNDKGGNNFIQNFINELANYLATNLNQNKEVDSFLSMDEIEQKYNLTSQFSIELRNQRDEIIKDYLQNSTEESLYFVTYKNEAKNNYTISQYNKEGKNTSFGISGEDLPKDVRKDVVLKKEDDKFVVDYQATETIMNKISDCAEKLAQEQNTKLNKSREENGLYQVVDISSNGVYLQNMSNNQVFEEVDIPKELLNQIGNDYILRYKDGTYTLEQELTDKFFENLK